MKVLLLATLRFATTAFQMLSMRRHYLHCLRPPRPSRKGFDSICVPISSCVGAVRWGSASSCTVLADSTFFTLCPRLTVLISVRDIVMKHRSIYCLRCLRSGLRRVAKPFRSECVRTRAAARLILHHTPHARPLVVLCAQATRCRLGYFFLSSPESGVLRCSADIEPRRSFDRWACVTRLALPWVHLLSALLPFSRCCMYITRARWYSMQLQSCHSALLLLEHSPNWSHTPVRAHILWLMFQHLLIYVSSVQPSRQS